MANISNFSVNLLELLKIGCTIFCCKHRIRAFFSIPDLHHMSWICPIFLEHLILQIRIRITFHNGCACANKQLTSAISFRRLMQPPAKTGPRFSLCVVNPCCNLAAPPTTLEQTSTTQQQDDSKSWGSHPRAIKQ